MDDRQYLIDLAMSFYVDEPCRICGKLIQPDDLHGLIFAGYSKDNKARSAYGECWRKEVPKSEWTYAEDDHPRN